ncbi:MarR family winged helix-turn-helix transcriptional regulator [Rothia kristinae]
MSTMTSDRAGAAADGAEEPRWLSPEERDAWLCLSAIMFQLPGQLENQLQRDSGLGFVEYMVLAMLSEAPEQRLSMSDLSAQTSTRLARLSRVVKRLEEQGFVRRSTSTVDRRVTLCHLLPVGLEVLEAAAPGHVEQVRRSVFNHLTRRQVTQLAGIGKALLGGKPSAVINAQLERGQRPRLGEACPGDDAER